MWLAYRALAKKACPELEMLLTPFLSSPISSCNHEFTTIRKSRHVGHWHSWRTKVYNCIHWRPKPVSSWQGNPVAFYSIRIANVFLGRVYTVMSVVYRLSTVFRAVYSQPVMSTVILQPSTAIYSIHAMLQIQHASWQAGKRDHTYSHSYSLTTSPRRFQHRQCHLVSSFWMDLVLVPTLSSCQWQSIKTIDISGHLGI